MAIKYAIEKHVSAFPSKLLAQNGGKHIVNVTISKDRDNGAIISLGDMVELDRYEDADNVTGFSAKVVAKAANGNYYVEVANPGEGTGAFLIYQQPVIAEEYTNEFKKLSNFYNAKGDTVRAYELAKHDIFEISANGFDGTVEVGKEISTVTNGKMVIS